MHESTATAVTSIDNPNPKTKSCFDVKKMRSDMIAAKAYLAANFVGFTYRKHHFLIRLAFRYRHLRLPTRQELRDEVHDTKCGKFPIWLVHFVHQLLTQKNDALTTTKWLGELDRIRLYAAFADVLKLNRECFFSYPK